MRRNSPNITVVMLQTASRRLAAAAFYSAGKLLKRLSSHHYSNVQAHAVRRAFIGLSGQMQCLASPSVCLMKMGMY